ncbi:MAG: ferritin-like domain-containing protein [Planctomycetes bacterium]|jgi:rubrerythrin|nr:ferritin-like domain-containing protein [Planctomycetota bacterium]
MNPGEVVEVLAALARLDMDAVVAYEQAIAAVDVVAIRDRFAQFRYDHERHVDELTTTIRNLGFEPPSPKSGNEMEPGLLPVTPSAGAEAALDVMHTNERLISRRYTEASRMKLPLPILTLVAKNCRDEQRHFQYVEQTLAIRTWGR